METQIAKTDLTLGKVCSHQGKKVEVMGFQSVQEGPFKTIVVKVRGLHSRKVYPVLPCYLDEVAKEALN